MLLKQGAMDTRLQIVRSHFQEATDIYKRLLVEDDAASFVMSVFVALSLCVCRRKKTGR